MDVSYVTALAALGGAALGGFTSFASSWTTLRFQMRGQETARSKSRRQKLYTGFIDEATTIYGDALIHDKLGLAGLIGLYALISKMRVVSSQAVIESAVRVATLISDTYREPNKTSEELEVLIHNGGVDFLKDFSNACREEFENKTF